MRKESRKSLDMTPKELEEFLKDTPSLGGFGRTKLRPLPKDDPNYKFTYEDMKAMAEKSELMRKLRD